MEENKSPLPNNQEPVKVILADDDKDDQQVFKEALSQTSIPTELTTVDNGQELMDNLKDQSQPNPDIIFLDINMPVMDGQECLKEIKADEDLKDIPTVIYSTSSHEKDIKDSYYAGAELYLQKPVYFKNLVLFLKKIFSLKWAGTLFKPLFKNFFMSEKNFTDRTAGN